MWASFQVPRPSSLAGLAALSLALCAVSCRGDMLFGPSVPGIEGVLVGAGDIADCASPGAQATAALLAGISGAVFTAGDNAYPHGSAEDFRRCYEPTWGRHKSRTHPSPGNHEYETPGAAAYFSYFGARAGPLGLGYYSFSVGEWVVFSLNSNIDAGAGSAQAMWLRGELEQLRPRCLAAIWHHSIFSADAAGHTAMHHIWGILQDFDAELVVSGHDHFYERFAPIDARGAPSPRGIRLFIVGTGGAPLTPTRVPRPASEAWGSVWGVLKLTLQPSAYRWEFVTVPPAPTVYDAGSGTCR